MTSLEPEVPPSQPRRELLVYEMDEDGLSRSALTAMFSLAGGKMVGAKNHTTRLAILHPSLHSR